MSNIITAGNATNNGTSISSDTSGVLELKTGSTPTTAIAVDASQNVGIGTSSPAVNLDVLGTTGFRVKYGAGAGLLVNQLSSAGDVYFNNQANAAIVVATNNVERMRIDSSGNLLVGTTTQLNSARATWQTATNNSRYIGFQTTAGAEIGYIFNNTTATQYSTTSDYRLKQDVVPMTGALAKVEALKPVTYKWKFDNSDGEGFIAHELQEICPHAVVGQKDEVNSDGNPVYQGIDTSFLVATLTAAIQEQQALIQDLTTRLEKLEAK
jgi:hypothetical protein